MSQHNPRKSIARIIGMGLIAASATGLGAAAAQAAPVTADAAPATSASTIDRTARSIDGVNSQVLVDGQLVTVKESKSSWTSKDAIFKIRPHAQEDIKIKGTDVTGKAVSFQLTFNKTDIGPQAKLVEVDGARDGARTSAQTVKFLKVNDSTDLAQVNLLTDGGHTLQFNLLATR